MKAIEYLNNLVSWGNVFAPLAIAEQIRNAAITLGYPVCVGAYDADSDQITLYLNR